MNKLDANALASLLIARLTIAEVVQALANNGLSGNADLVRARFSGWHKGNNGWARYEVDAQGDADDCYVYVRWDDKAGMFKAEF
jgi:hypothetical protein